MIKSRITARGTRWGNNYEVSVTQDENDIITVLFNGHEQDILRKGLEKESEFTPPMANNYHPEPGTMLAFYYAFETSYFDELESLHVEGDIGTIPYEDGVLY